MRSAEAEPAPDFFGAEQMQDWGRKPPRLPQPSPVVPLGVLGKSLIFLDSLQQIVVEPPRSCSKGELALWFGDEYLIEHFPSYPKNYKAGDPVEDFNQTKAQMALINDCRAKNIFNPQGKVLGRGAHRPKADESLLVLHLGRSVLISRPNGNVERHPAGMVRISGKDVFFPAADNLPPPSDRAATRSEGEEVLEMLHSWNWISKAAPLLMLGWIAQGYICGWLDWRAHIWLVSPTASGKSTLQKRIRALLDDWCLSTADASEAAIRQILGNDTLAVSIDEAEAHDNPEKLQAVMNLMKKGSSGDRILRGSQDHKGVEFTAQSAFLLSSVLHAPFRGEDRNRIALLEMRPLADDAEPLDLELAKWRSLGRRLHRRMVEQAPRFERTYTAYKRAISAHRYTGRWQDTYGTLLACADLLLYDLAPDAADDAMLEPGMVRVQEAVTSILPLLAMGRSEARTDTERVVQHLVSYPLPGSHGHAPEPVGAWLERAMRTKITPGQFATEPAEYHGPDEAARKRLMAYGLRVVARVDKGKGKFGIEDALLDEQGWESGYVAVAYATNKALAGLFVGTEWAGGGWLQSLKKIDGAIGGQKVRFNTSMPDNALLVPLSAFRGDEG
ncbi:hypothetical protein EDF59_110140 [Novosphingobium sp. ST904]|nr:hypothetical protein EDF59_110140 [Novosphingobium sp. ST904]